MGKGIVKLGEGNWAVKDGNLLAAKDTNGRFKNAEFTVTRGTDATYVGRDGLIVNETGDNTPRIDFTDNTDGHLLLEPQSTNLITYSEDFGSSKWSRNDIDSDYGHQSPTGLSTATKITATGTDPYVFKHVNVTQNQTYTFSFYCKGEGSSLGKTARVLFWYGAGTATGSTTSHEFNLTSDWERIQFQTTPTASGTLPFRIDIPANDTTEVGDVAYIWGAQLEALSYPTSYIPTNGSTVTRDAETCINAGEPADFNNSEGVLYFEGSKITTGYTYMGIGVSDGSADNLAVIKFRNTGSLIWAVHTGNTNSTIIQHTPTDISANNKIALKWDSSKMYLYVNGVKIDEQNIGASISSGALDRLNFNAAYTNFENFYGKCKTLRVYKEALSHSELITLTS